MIGDAVPEHIEHVGMMNITVPEHIEHVGMMNITGGGLER